MLLDIVALVGFAVVLEPLLGVKEFIVSSNSRLAQSCVDDTRIPQIFSGVVSVFSMLSVASICLAIYALSGVVFVL